jgi:hypothetical protein
MTSDLSQQQAGEVCNSCQERWEGKRQRPRKLVNLPEVTQVYHQKVACCPYCDGPALEIAIANTVPKKKKS